uniref:SEC63 domain-containing protein n=1 Tax=Attheya septentrionalis TaxID=420275 RepID=A0A7S2U649_9STRA|mmetsp:Transcript_12148/g.22043  ORF Transcript_12148/g.22043 Transcript_12148/m.22043 type:complete len:521 (+) Transcript_12148:69-1631(+)
MSDGEAEEVLNDLMTPVEEISMSMGMMAAVSSVGLLLLVALYHVLSKRFNSNKNAAADADAGASGEMDDAKYLATKLNPDSTHFDVLLCIATCPENVRQASKEIAKAEELRTQKLAFLAKEKSKGPKQQDSMDFSLNDGGWADDEDEDDDAAAAAKKAAAENAEKEQAIEKAQLDAATGKNSSPEHIKLEGIDEGVLGQTWVESALTKAGVWPPPLSAPKTTLDWSKMTLPDPQTGKQVSLIKHSAVRRNLCMTMARLNALMLNTHPELLEAGGEGLIDPTYFKAAAEFRQRTGFLLEAALRIAIATRSYQLTKTIVEAVSMFKIGTMTCDDAKTLEWFKTAMKRQYGGEEGIPTLDITEENIETEGEKEISAGDVCTLEMKVERKHAEQFTKQKLIMCQKQGIPPQIGMQSYREGWWILVRVKRMDGDGKTPLEEPEDEEDGEGSLNKLLTAWPFIVSNIAQKSGKIKLNFKAPSAPGKYRFYIAIKSQEFLGTDQEVTIDRSVLQGKDEDDQAAKKTK